MKYIGIDNGVTGSICVLDEGHIVHWTKTPVRKVASYAKTGRYMNRIDRKALRELLLQHAFKSKVIMEYPMFSIDVYKHHATISAAMSLEATWAIVEDLKIPYMFIAAVTWQKVMMPNCPKGETKRMSRDLTKRLFPDFELCNGCDGDAVLLAEYARRCGL